ncbi:hypothetical protein Esti_006262 [Eimeria stiedai]
MSTHKDTGMLVSRERTSKDRDALSSPKEQSQMLSSFRLHSTRSSVSTETTNSSSRRRSSESATQSNTQRNSQTGAKASLTTERQASTQDPLTKRSLGLPSRIWHALPAWTLEFESLTNIQRKVMEYVAAMAEIESASAKARLKRAWSAFNIPEEDFSAIELYLAKKVPLTIRVDIQGLFPHLLHDSFYRTAFETMNKGTHYLEARREFERVLFDGLYEHPSVQPQDRPKYGVLNMVCNPFSDTRVSCFGSAYLLLKDSLRARTTVATSKENLGNHIRRVGTLDHLWHVIESLSPHEITRIHAVATGKRAKATVSPDSKYSEIQVHGMLDMRKDVAAVVVQRQDLKCPARGPLIEDLSMTYLIPILTCEELDELLGDRRWSTVVNQRANLLFQKTMAINDASFQTSTRWIRERIKGKKCLFAEENQSGSRRIRCMSLCPTFLVNKAFLSQHEGPRELVCPLVLTLLSI